ncbi:hypothetical protein EVAR_48227_1 [Eumeta japonica]|uniref:Reverse transcriptase domain-containing protein n=1 Tax=Eumeta variegata TaxID=151549 RepID=A0A4C1YDS1_EUMVA|nr:hypothetical protein EVAR_48227_1 [Eumeta japonica]
MKKVQSKFKEAKAYLWLRLQESRNGYCAAAGASPAGTRGPGVDTTIAAHRQTEMRRHFQRRVLSQRRCTPRKAFKLIWSRLDELSVKCLLYANDQVILAPSACGLQEMLNKMNDSVNKRCMKVNEGETKVMVFKSAECDLLTEEPPASRDGRAKFGNGGGAAGAHARFKGFYCINRPKSAEELSAV